MSLSEEEQTRLYNFKKSSQTNKRTQFLDLPKEKKYLETDFAFFKKKLKVAIASEDKEVINKNIQSLLELIARKFTLTIREKEEIYDTVPDIIIQEETKNYIDECYRLLAIRQKLIQK